MKNSKRDQRSPQTGNRSRRKNPRPPATSSGVTLSHFRKSRCKRAQKILDAHYRNLLVGGRLIVVEETKSGVDELNELAKNFRP